jgi:hypothetical protein
MGNLIGAYRAGDFLLTCGGGKRPRQWNSGNRCSL